LNNSAVQECLAARVRATFGRFRTIHGPVPAALRPMHDAACVGVKRVAAMHDTPVVPNDEIAYMPFMAPRELWLATSLSIRE
jgi:hypothetical protein